ncbi:pleckstrin homology domain-containing family O member 2 [Synchiropus splendidus]|uniref:pleckstrin homology domain-containing family O member 2 n=1 Tax=Synchiropus splendidus TaxID=270530 RepID=UPI00237DA8F3|nr:pleckstrin homology domain-containing family O member 2 [Synchiropus splendidus]
MEDEVKAELVQGQELKLQGKAGWIKKAVGRLLPSYKERYVHLEKTEIAVYENEDLKNCLERLDLENYDMCQELKSPFKKKHRLVLIHSAKAGNKVPDMKFQTQSAEEKEAWIKALADGINRAKNKVFDEIKVDESCNLDHVTRSRPKGNRGRRPPTRIHMKEVADLSSDGILRLDLDLENAVLSPGNQLSAVAEAEEDGSRGEAAGEPGETQEAEPVVKKKVVMPPMPPSKGTKPILIPAGDEDSEQLHEPSPPAPDADVSMKGEGAAETSPEAVKKPPPTPPAKPASRSTSDEVESSAASHPPAPPPTNMKPSCTEDMEEEGETPAVLSAEEDALSDISSHMSAFTPEEHPSGVTGEGELPSPPDSDDLFPEAHLPVPSVLVTTCEPSLSPLLCHRPGEKKKSEEKSVDSGQHSDSDSEFSLDGDMLAASTSALRGSSAGLDALDISEDLSRSLAEARLTSTDSSLPALAPSAKTRSASSGDLLSSFTSHTEESRTSRGADQDQVMELETVLFAEMEKTSELLRVSRRVGEGEVAPEDILAKAMEKLRKADHVLREVKKLTLVKNRNSW